MPELPEVETTRSGISPFISQQRISDIVVRNPNLRWPVPSNLAELSIGQTVQCVDRRSKYLLLKLDHGCIIIHLGMSGSLTIANNTTTQKKHDHVDICFKNGVILRYNDPRRFGAILWSDNPNDHPRLTTLGPEPLGRGFNRQHLTQICANKSAAIKTIIMNAKCVVGVGNIYANEALFHSNIHPETPANQLKPKQINQLCTQIKRVLRLAIKAGGTTLKDYSQADGKPGYFQQKLWVYGRTGENCLRCQHTIRRINQQQRASFVCPNCQPQPQQVI